MAINISRSAFSLVLHKRGCPSHEDVTKLLTHYQHNKNVLVDRQQYFQAVSDAVARYQATETCLFVCSNTTCSKVSSIELTEESINQLSLDLGCPVETTGCHWLCESAPVVTFKSGRTIESFVDCSSPERWRDVAETIRRFRQSAKLASSASTQA